MVTTNIISQDDAKQVVSANYDARLAQEHKRKLEERSLISDRISRLEYMNDDYIPTVSVIVPIYNADYTLDQALSSIEDQTFKDLEIICVNDASPDSSENIIEEHSKNDDRYVVVEHGTNCGYGASMNDGIAVARGKWIAVVEPDDYLYPKMYASLLRLVDISKVKDIDLVKSPYIREVRANGVKRGDEAERKLNCSYRGRVFPKKQPFNLSDASASHLLRHHPSIWSAIYNRDFLVDKEIFFVEYPGSGWADNEFFYETLLQADNILYTDVPYYVYREETDEEFENFARNNKRLPFDRWHSMQDIIERLKIDDENILRSQVSKGFTYLNGQLKANGEDDPIIQEEMDKMFDRMDPIIVDMEPKINLALRDKFYDYCQYYFHSPHKFEYKLGLISEFFYTLKNNGISYALKCIKKVLH